MERTVGIRAPGHLAPEVGGRMILGVKHPELSLHTRAVERTRTRVSAMLLGALLLAHALRPLIHSSWGRAAWLALILVLAMWATLRRPLTRAIGLVATVVACGLVLGPRQGAQLGALTGTAAIVAFASTALLGHVLRQREVRTATILDALSVYLLFALFWTLVFALIQELAPGSFHGLPESPDPALARELGFESLGYFSLVTLTTLGYGDIVPVGAWARTMAGLEALLGQLFLVVLVARLVSLHASASGRET